nr:unnamed protein product [Callosobruchus chinensis]
MCLLMRNATAWMTIQDYSNLQRNIEYVKLKAARLLESPAVCPSFPLNPFINHLRFFQQYKGDNVTGYDVYFSLSKVQQNLSSQKNLESSYSSRVRHRARVPVSPLPYRARRAYVLNSHIKGHEFYLKSQRIL